MATVGAVTIREELRAGLKVAMQTRDKASTGAIRSALGAIDNAEAVDTTVATDRIDGDSRIAGAVAGAGSTEVRRRTLSDQRGRRRAPRRDRRSARRGRRNTTRPDPRASSAPRCSVRKPPRSTPSSATDPAAYFRSRASIRRAAIAIPMTVSASRIPAWTSSTGDHTPRLAARTSTTPWYSGLSCTTHAQLPYCEIG